MMRWVREFRLIPVVLIAIVCLFALKTLGLLLDGRYTLGGLIGGAPQRGAPSPKAALLLSGKPLASRAVEPAPPAAKILAKAKVTCPCNCPKDQAVRQHAQARPAPRQPCSTVTSRPLAKRKAAMSMALPKACSEMLAPIWLFMERQA